ncbi:hypothetical protein PMI06_005807 [Burkholderia sp. BT03]|nr:hypothetical protein PMI06_005807 [Burkholderia sp. BT03]SKC83277.1 hypothetical protein SAMN06266956_4100 [Paraburkholderia hospita]
MRLRGGLVVAFALVPARRGRCRLGLLAFLRRHPRIAFVLQALPFGVLAFALASALCLRASGVAPVRGGTYFSLPPQRKVGKRKRLTPSARVLIHGPPTSPRFTRQCPGRCSLPTLRMNASPTSDTHTRTSGSEWFVPPRWQTVCRLSRRIAWRSYQLGRVRYRSEVRRVERKGPTHSLPPGRRWTIWQGMLKRGSVKRVRRTARALATNLNREVAARSKGPVGGPQAGRNVGGVSRFLLPTFLCGGKEK